MRIETIFLDMDGVVADFVGASLALYHETHYEDRGELPEQWPPEWPPGEWDVSKVLGMEIDDFWQMIEEEPLFWSGLQQYPWAGALRDSVGAFCDDVKYLSAPSRDPRCAFEKICWLRNFTRDEHFMGWALTPHKHYLAGPGRVLIDDSDLNCKAWEAAGGEAILFPQPWNQLHNVQADKLHFVIQELGRIKGKLERQAA